MQRVLPFIAAVAVATAQASLLTEERPPAGPAYCQKNMQYDTACVHHTGLAASHTRLKTAVAATSPYELCARPRAVCVESVFVFCVLFCRPFSVSLIPRRLLACVCGHPCRFRFAQSYKDHMVRSSCLNAGPRCAIYPPKK